MFIKGGMLWSFSGSEFYFGSLVEEVYVFNAQKTHLFSRTTV